MSQVDKFKMALKTVDVTFQNLDSSEISLTDVSHYYDSDPTKVVSSLRDDKKKPSSFMADTTTANAQVRAVTVGLDEKHPFTVFFPYLSSCRLSSSSPLQRPPTIAEDQPQCDPKNDDPNLFLYPCESICYVCKSRTLL